VAASACAAPDDTPTPSDSTTPPTEVASCDAPIGAWASVDLPSNREGMGIAADEEHVYVVGGWTPEGTTAEVWIGTRDGDTLVWTDGPALPVPIEHPAAGLTGGRFWFLGGDDEDGLRTDVFSADVANGVVGGWVVGEPLDEPLTWVASARDGEHLFFVGGSSDFDSAPSAAVHRLEAGDDGAYTLVPQTPLPEGRFAASAVAADSVLYVVGGATSFSSAADTVWRAPIDDGTVGDWEELATLEDTLIVPALAVTGDTLIVAGGASNWYVEERRVWQVSLADGGVRHAPRLPEPRLGQGSARLGDQWILVGGWSDLSGVMHDTAAVTTLCPG
jgi:hypothetical protein